MTGLSILSRIDSRETARNGNWLSFKHRQGDAVVYVCCCGWWAAWSTDEGEEKTARLIRAIDTHEHGCDVRQERGRA